MSTAGYGQDQPIVGSKRKPLDSKLETLDDHDIRLDKFGNGERFSDIVPLLGGIAA